MSVLEFTDVPITSFLLSDLFYPRIASKAAINNYSPNRSAFTVWRSAFGGSPLTFHVSPFDHRGSHQFVRGPRWS